MLHTLKLIIGWKNPEQICIHSVIVDVQSLCIASRSNGIMAGDILEILPALYGWGNEYGSTENVQHIHKLINGFHIQVTSYKFGKMCAVKLINFYSKISLVIVWCNI